MMRRLALIAFLSVAMGCVPSLRPVKPAPKPNAFRIVVLRSDLNPVYDEPVEAFVSEMSSVAEVFVEDVAGKTSRFARQVQNIQPDLVFALGRRAVLFQQAELPDVPLLFAMVVNYQRLGLKSARGVMGVALELPAVAEFSQFALVVPNMKRVVAFYKPEESEARVSLATESLKTMGIELRAVALNRIEDLPTRYAANKAGVDAVWLMNDPAVMNPLAFDFLRAQTVRDKLPFLCSLSAEFVRAGALISVAVDFRSLAFQAAAASRLVISGAKSVEDLGIQSPIGARTVLNLGVARSIGLEVHDDVLPSIDDVVLPAAP